MQRKQTVKAKRLADYEKAAITGVRFQVTGDTVKSINLETSIGPLEFLMESYNLCAYENAPAPMREVFRATVTDSRGQVPDFHKDFEDKYERDTWVNRFDSENARFDVAVSEFQEPEAA